MYSGLSADATATLLRIDAVVKNLGYMFGKGVNGVTPLTLCLELVDKTIDFNNFDQKILDPACGKGSFLLATIKRFIEAGCSVEQAVNMVHGVDNNHSQVDHARVNIQRATGVSAQIECADSLTKEFDMKFDVVIGNPPYQDGTKDGGQNKIYNFFAKKSLELLSETGLLSFITPTSVCKISKRFSIIGLSGLKHVDFTANEHFDVGAKICSWSVDNGYSGDVTVKCSSGVDTVPSGNVIYDYSEIDKDFGELYQALRKATKDTTNRMFKHNSIDMTRCRSQTQDNTFKYPVYKLNSDGTSTVCQYNSVKPKLYKQQSFTVAISKKFDESMTVVNDLDYDMTNISTPVNSADEVENIKSFIFSKYFRTHVEKWKRVDGYGWNYATLYLPAFDKTKNWANDEVKAFIESHTR